MNPLESVDVDRLLAGEPDWIDSEVASRLAAHPLEAIETEFPHYVHSMAAPDGPPRPREQHPVFYGCYDWHSAVHSHWALVRQLRLLAAHPDREPIVTSIDDRLTREHVEREVAHLEENPTFERPYGWVWLLCLAAELELWEDPPADRWAGALTPLEEWIVETIIEWLPLDRPFRVGTHGNSAFALNRVLEYATVVGDTALESQVRDTALACFQSDRDYPLGYEPLGWDFLSPGLTEAYLVSRLLDPAEFAEWFEGFLPGPSLPDAVGQPIHLDPDPESGMALHYAGLNLSRAWCLASISESLETTGHTLAPTLETAARVHARVGIDGAFTDDYAGAHWLSSFALYLLTRAESGIALE